MILNNAPQVGVYDVISVQSHQAIISEDSWVAIPVYWSEIEPYPGEYEWKWLDDQIFAIREQENRKIILSVRNSPQWARDSELECKPPNNNIDYINFLGEIPKRYPNTVFYFEIWNEPDVRDEFTDLYTAHYFGCFGDNLFAGEQYGILVSDSYVRLKSIDSRFKIIAGSMAGMHDDFIQGMLKTSQFDFISYHAYVNYPENNLQIPFQKAEWVRSYTDKPIIITETAVACNDDLYACNDNFEDTQVDHWNSLVSGAGDYDIRVFIWYTIASNGWMNTDLWPHPVWNLYWNYYRYMR